MDIQSEKLRLIEQLTQLQDENLIKQIKVLLNETKNIVGTTSEGKSINQSDLIQRAKASNKAIEAGKITSIDDLEKETKDWLL
ncbi:hypothetical protein [Reichenbachiella ulvae]|uniref:Addiction module component n=1 Tax=Reichenbachiella ulvae TaxID=2980104 RepID=A0ABT3CVK9_9BACT|nr:hypothetical protein [Reichenbachiella ulvae]MCV9387732.1 hypothetical protein [Reichenbachiella ulvae]